MSSGASKRNENPRSRVSKWWDDTPQIGQNTVHPLDAVTTQPSSHEAEIGLDENESRIVGQVPPRIAVLIEGKQTPAVGKPLEMPREWPPPPKVTST